MKIIRGTMFEPTGRSGIPVSKQVLLLAAAVVAIVTLGVLFDPDPFAEGGTVERSTTVVLFLTAGALFVAPRAGPWQNRWHLVAIPILLGLREMDLDKAVLSEGILQLRLYTGDAPVAEKLAGAAVVAVVLWITVRLTRRDLPNWLRGLRERRPMPLLLLVAGLAVVAAKTLDGLERKLEPFGLTLPPGAPGLLAAIEESLELGFALALLVAVRLWWPGDARA